MTMIVTTMLIMTTRLITTLTGGTAANPGDHVTGVIVSAVMRGDHGGDHGG